MLVQKWHQLRKLLFVGRVDGYPLKTFGQRWRWLLLPGLGIILFHSTLFQYISTRINTCLGQPKVMHIHLQHQIWIILSLINIQTFLFGHVLKYLERHLLCKSRCLIVNVQSFQFFSNMRHRYELNIVSNLLGVFIFLFFFHLIYFSIFFYLWISFLFFLIKLFFW